MKTKLKVTQCFKLMGISVFSTLIASVSLFTTAGASSWASDGNTSTAQVQTQPSTGEVAAKLKAVPPSDAKVKTVALSSENNATKKLELNCMTPAKQDAPGLNEVELGKVIDQVPKLCNEIQRKYSVAEIGKARQEAAQEVCKLIGVIKVRESGGDLWVTFSNKFSLQIPMSFDDPSDPFM